MTRCPRMAVMPAAACRGRLAAMLYVAHGRGDGARSCAATRDLALAGGSGRGARRRARGRRAAARGRGSRHGGRRPRSLALLAAAALAWPLAEWNTPAAGGAFTAGLLLYAAWPPLLAAAALRGPDERPLEPAGRRRSSASRLRDEHRRAGGRLGGGLRPARPGVPAVPGQPTADRGRRRRVARPRPGGPRAQRGVGGGLRRARRRPAGGAPRPPAAGVAAPVLVPAVVAVALFGADAAARPATAASSPTTRPTARCGSAQIAALALVAAGVALGRWSRPPHACRRSRGSWSTSAPRRRPAACGERLAATLGDPALELLHRRRRRRGSTPTAAPCRCRRAPEPRGHARRAPAGADVSPSCIAEGCSTTRAASEIAAAARLALEHERLHAARRARTRASCAPRARGIVAAADAKRRRLERDLHDGAQQRLVTLALGVRLARRRHRRRGPAARRRARHGRGGAARGGGRAARARARALPGGRSPRRGSPPRSSPRRARARGSCRRTLPDAPLRCSGRVGRVLRSSPRRCGSRRRRRRRRRRDRETAGCVVDVHAGAGVRAAPLRVEDRVGAVGGTVTVADRELRAELPCAS